MVVEENGYKSQRHFVVAAGRPEIMPNQQANKFFEYQLKETKETQTLYKEGKWFREALLEVPR